MLARTGSPTRGEPQKHRQSNRQDERCELQEILRPSLHFVRPAASVLLVAQNRTGQSPRSWSTSPKTGISITPIKVLTLDMILSLFIPHRTLSPILVPPTYQAITPTTTHFVSSATVSSNTLP